MRRLVAEARWAPALDWRGDQKRPGLGPEGPLEVAFEDGSSWQGQVPREVADLVRQGLAAGGIHAAPKGLPAGWEWRARP